MASLGEIAALGVVVAGAIAMIARPLRYVRTARKLAIGALLLTTCASTAVLRRGAAASLPTERPGAGTTLGYVSSSACLGCHPGEHASFSRTYHRTMTQVATAGVVHAPLDGRPLVLDDRTIRLSERSGGEVWATLPDPDAVIAGTPAADVTRRVVITTGSHREQAFWVAGKRQGDLRLVPFVWLVRESAFVPRREAFIVPPNGPMPPVRWASSCIACHAVAGEPRHDPKSDVFDTRTAELGVTCEACHGPGAAHVEHHRDPVARYMQRASKRADPTIVHPARLSPERSAAVCGQCHAYAFPKDENGWWTDGYSRTFRAGELLDASRTLISAGTDSNRKAAPVIDAPADAIFWPDGGVRVGGREYNGLVLSPCYEKGHGDRKMTCLSCHSMHKGDPAGQIAPDRVGNAGCTTSTCHSDFAFASNVRSQNHSHHAAGSVGSECVACHMPKTSYALLSAVRSHRIESPNVGNTLTTGKPNACNLCHVDRSLEWTARVMSDWYGARPMTPSPLELHGRQRAQTPTGLRDGIAGDAGVRALIADALGSKDAAAACGGGTAFQRSVLEQMREDPYAAVRFIVARSLRGLPKSDPGAKIDNDEVRALIKARDVRPMTIAE